MKKQLIDTKVHESVKNRKIFKAKMLLITLGLVVILLGCGAMFTFGTVTWDPDAGFEPAPAVKYAWQAWLIACGAVLAVGSLVSYFFICYKSFKRFYSTQEIYWKTKKFERNKSKALKVVLYQLKKKDLKWYKKIGYITSDEMKHALEEQSVWIKSLKAKNKKINYAKSLA